MRKASLLLWSLALLAPFGAACSAASDATTSTSSGGGSGKGATVGSGGHGGESGSSTTTGSGGAGGNGGSSSSTGGPSFACPVKFTYQSPGGISNVRIAGEWNGFDLSKATVMDGPNASGLYTATIPLAPGLQGYKIVYDQNGSTNWILDPTQGRRKYVGGTENSGVKVADCRLPTFAVQSTKPDRPSAGQGTYQATLAYQDGIDASGADVTGFTATLRHDDVETALPASAFTVAANGDVSVSLTGLADGKYRVMVTGKSKSGQVSEPLRLVFWVEAESYSWNDALIYLAVTDRYKDGDPTNNAPPTANTDPRGDWQGGDLQGVKQSIDDGTFDKLGVRAIWLTPFFTNAAGAYPAADNVHQVTGYHGYWPIKAREVDPRIGGEQALKDLVTSAHAHGIRILQDFMLNDVHQDHEYVKAHPDWFRTGCVCGTDNCDWTVHALDCMFASYLPDANHTVPELTAQLVSDAVWWIDTFDLDGLRVDAVKHTEPAATRNLAAEVRETFEPGGTHHFLMGETAMGWSDCADPCNDENYDTISSYVGPLGLDGQFDFVLYYAATFLPFAYQDKGMIHADYWFTHGQAKWPAGSIMTPYIGSHDTARFTSLADYRGQDAAHDRGIPNNQWTNIAGAPTDPEPYLRQQTGLAWLLGLPGAPLLYYGDEYGQSGGVDPNNRVMHKPEASLDANEAALLAFTRKLGTARKNVMPLRRGSYVSLYNTSEDTLAFGRLVSPGQAAVVALTRLATPQTVTVNAAALGFAAQSTLHDAMGGPDVTVAAGGSLSITIPAHGAVILSP